MVYWIAATILTLVNAVGVAINLLMLPGNWLMVLSLCLFLLTAGHADSGPDWTTLIVVVLLAALGEVLEMVTGSVKAAKLGASRRAMLLSFVLSIGGSIAGTFVIPVPVIGTAIGAVLGAAFGAFFGAWLGESWKGTAALQRSQISEAAMIGRLIGMFAKLGVGVAIFAFQLVSLWL